MMYKTKDGLIFRTKPWKHQLQALRYLMEPEHDCSGLLLKMGAGKTKIWIDLINNKGFETTLIVCPQKASRVWVDQFPVHSVNSEILVVNLVKYSSQKKTQVIKEITRERKFGQQVVYIVNYDSIWREPFRTFIKDKMKFDAIICDESHRLKSPSSKASRFLQVLGRRCDHRYIATGTLLAQTPLDVYAQYRFLKPEIFGTNFEHFKSRYTKVDVQKSMRLGYEVLDQKTPYINTDELNAKIMSCAFSVDAELDLPPTRDILVEFDLPSKIEQRYKALKKDGVLEFGKGTLEVNNVLSFVLRLQQLTSGCVQLEDEDGYRWLKTIDDSRKKALRELLMDLPKDEPVVVFAKFRYDIEMIRQVCIDMDRTYSELSGKFDTYDEWNKGDTSVLIVQIESGAEGLDFTRAKYAIYYNLTHKLWVYKQSRERLHRPPQTHPVTYYFLLGKLQKGKSVDESILEALNRNEDFIQQILTEKSI